MKSRIADNREKNDEAVGDDRRARLVVRDGCCESRVHDPRFADAFANASASFRTLRRVCADAADDTPGLKVVFA